jgi:CDP-diacylglycerol--glycerol-3-phosphate 3-phosphatidyltransferase
VSGSFVSPELRTKVRAMAEPVGRALARVGLSPNALTVIGFLIACVAALAAGAQVWPLAGFLILFGGVFDMFDGLVARATGTASKAGAFMDSTFDRWGEGVVYVGITAGCLLAGYDLGAVLAAAAMSSAFMVSYARARSESLGFAPGKGMANVGLAPREVRLVILAAGVALAGVNLTILGFTLGLITVLATITTIQRIVVTLRQANQQQG